MTRGYVCITKGKNEIVNVAYLSSDAYLSWYGLQILKAIENATVNHGINAWVENQRNENIACNGNDSCHVPPYRQHNADSRNNLELG